MHSNAVMLKYYPNALLFESRMYCQVSGFLKGRYIGENIRQILEVIEYYETSKKAGLYLLQTLRRRLIKLGSTLFIRAFYFFYFGESDKLG